VLQFNFLNAKQILATKTIIRVQINALINLLITLSLNPGGNSIFVVYITYFIENHTGYNCECIKYINYTYT